MKPYASLRVIGFLCLAFSCKSPGAGEESPKAKRTVVDAHTLSNHDSVWVKHLDLDISIDFKDHEIIGRATWQLDNPHDAASVVFDTKDLMIDSVLLGDGNKARFELGPSDDPVLGSPLRVYMAPKATVVSIYYRTSPSSTALQWLSPQQTFGKKSPFLYTQSESIHARSWIPCQDGPGIRFTYTAQVHVPKGLMALMSAENPQKISDNGTYSFQMDKPIPAYLMALAVGDIAFRPISQRTGVYAEPVLLDKGYNELSDLEKMVEVAEGLYGPYRWGRYDVLFLPSGFPIGGMENPKLTFSTPTILAGDKSLVNLIAHELAHSWSGNLVTNATWNDFWLNEGFTVYFERRISEALYGKDYADMLWELGYQDLTHTIADMGAQNKDTKLKLDLDGRDPDLGLTDIAYEKGAALLHLIELTVGRAQMDTFLRGYFDHYAFQTINTEAFIAYLNEHLLNKKPEWKQKINIKEWIYGTGLPADCPRGDNPLFQKVDMQRAAFLEGKKANELDVRQWNALQWMQFLRGMPQNLTIAQMEQLDRAFHFTQSKNSEIEALWFELSIHTGYETAYPAMKDFLYVTGRQKFLEPLYLALSQTDKGKKMAEEIYKAARPNYHPLSQKTIDKILNLSRPVAH